MLSNAEAILSPCENRKSLLIHRSLAQSLQLEVTYIAEGKLGLAQESCAE